MLHVVSIVGDQVDGGAGARSGGGEAQVEGSGETIHDSGVRRRACGYVGWANWSTYNHVVVASGIRYYVGLGMVAVC